MGSFCTLSMEDNSHMRPLHAERHYPACDSFSPAHQQTTFRASTFRLQTSPGQQRWSLSSRQPQLREYISTHVAVNSFLLSDEGSNSNRARSVKQPGSAKASAPSSSKSSSLDLSLTYTSVGSWEDSGFVPIITVGSVFALAEERWASLLTHISHLVGAVVAGSLCPADGCLMIAWV